MTLLTVAQKKHYADNGFVAVEGLVPQTYLERMKARIDYLCEHWDSPEAERAGVGHEMDQGNTAVTERTALTVRRFEGLTQHEPDFEQYMRESKVEDVAAELIGTPLLLAGDQAMLKPPEVGSEKPFHQDNAYFQVTPDDALITCWCALDEATPNNGCLYYLAGSHKRGLVEHEQIENTPHLSPVGLRSEDAVPVPAKPGTVVFHHGWALHTSPPNQTRFWRRAMVMHFVRAEATSSSGQVRSNLAAAAARKASNPA